MDPKVSKAIANLGIDDDGTVRLMESFSNATFHYRTERGAIIRAGDTAKQVAILDGMALFMRKAVFEVMEFSEEYRETLAQSINKHGRLGRDVPAVDLFLSIAAGIDDLTSGLRPPANRPPHLALERAIRTLLPALEDVAGPAKIKWNKANGKPPESVSPVTNALLAMLKNLDGDLQNTTIFNMIDKVRKKPEKPPPFVS